MKRQRIKTLERRVRLLKGLAARDSLPWFLVWTRTENGYVDQYTGERFDELEATERIEAFREAYLAVGLRPPKAVIIEGPSLDEVMVT